MPRKNKHDSEPRSNRYAKSEKAHETRKRRERVSGGIALAAAAGGLIFAGANSDRVHEALRSEPKPVAEQLSEAEYQTSVMRPALAKVESTINSIQGVKHFLEQKGALDKGSLEISSDTRTDKYTVFSSPDSIGYIQISDSGKPEDDGDVKSANDGSIEVSRDDNGTSIIVESNGVTLVDGLGGLHDSEVTFHNPNKDMVIDMADPSTIMRAVADPETVVEKAVTRGSFKSATEYDQSWSASLDSPLTVTFTQNEDGSFEASADTDVLETGYMQNQKNTPTMQDVLEFTFE